LFTDMTFEDFKKMVSVSKEEICRKILERNRDKIKVKKEKKVVENLVKIFDATLEISNREGFSNMTIRNLSKKSGLSTGALYSYFSTKDELLEMIQTQGREISRRILENQIGPIDDPREKLCRAIQSHLYLSEAMQPWFYFSYIEARNLSKTEQKKAIASEIDSEAVFQGIIEEGIRRGIYAVKDVTLVAPVLKAMLQDWYLKRWKYRQRKITIDQYADFVIDFVEQYLDG
jgi:TetR/AcrR family transcriptional regulator, cholesterol catabolism regulator